MSRKSSARPRIIVAASFLLLAGCSCAGSSKSSAGGGGTMPKSPVATAHPACEADGDCVGGRVCISGRCAVPGSCRDDADCGADGQCTDGTCEDPFECMHDDGCDAGMTCVSGLCEEAFQCNADADCGGQQICEQYLCVASHCAPTSPCSNGMPCTDRRCPMPPWAVACASVGGGSSPMPTTLRLQPFRFRQATAAVDADSEKDLHRIGVCLAAIVSQVPGRTVLIEGHSDQRGDAKENEALAAIRAKKVRDWLARRLPVLKDKVQVHSYGVEKLLCSTWSFECYERNRRVEFVVE